MIWPQEFFFKLMRHLAKNSKFIASAFAFCLWVKGLIDQAVIIVISQIKQAIDTLDLAVFSNVNLGGVSMIGVANAILPISEFVTVLGVYLTIWSTVIIIRWIKSFVPTVAN
jgi:hypothetical protein